MKFPLILAFAAALTYEYPGYTSIRGKLAAQYMKSTDSNVSKVFATLNVSITFAEFNSNYKKNL